MTLQDQLGDLATVVVAALDQGGTAYVNVGCPHKVTDHGGGNYTAYEQCRDCPTCDGTGKAVRTISVPCECPCHVDPDLVLDAPGCDECRAGTVERKVTVRLVRFDASDLRGVPRPVLSQDRAGFYLYDYDGKDRYVYPFGPPLTPGDWVAIIAAADQDRCKCACHIDGIPHPSGPGLNPCCAAADQEDTP